MKKITIISFLLISLIAFGKNTKNITITYKGESLRELSQKYFNNPNYWETILKFNSLNSESELFKGMKLIIPSKLVLDTEKKIIEAKLEIAKANKNGAKILTPKLIEKTEKYFDNALKLKQKGKWQEAYSSAQKALLSAKETNTKVEMLRKTSADAVLSYFKGKVQKRTPKTTIWKNITLYDKLYEADRARTLSNSIAEITFIDLSRIRLNENSQALIKHSRIDILKNRTNTKVKLIRGEAFAYLIKSPRKKFDLDIPGINVKINSRNFWIEKEKVATKIANYEGNIKLAAKDVVVIVKKNQGSIIPDGGVPSKPNNLLPPPSLLSPEEMEKIFFETVSLTWEKRNGTKSYWVEIATDANFKQIIYSDKKIKKTEITVPKMKKGLYYWHVSSIDKNDFPGQFSPYKTFIISEDLTKPFLVVNNPKNLTVVTEKSIKINGECEPGLKLLINNNPIQVNQKGEFSTTILLTERKNLITIKCIDKKKNESKISRIIYYEPSNKIANKITSKNYIPENKLFVVNSRRFTIDGITRPMSKIIFITAQKHFKTVADSIGHYNINLSITNNTKNLTQKIITPAGYNHTDTYSILLDTIPPIIVPDKNLKKITKSDLFVISGKVKGTDTFYINSEQISLTNNTFNKKIKLHNGTNAFELLAKDFAGNISLKKIEVFRDTTPPELHNYKLTKNKKNKTCLISLTVSDISGLKRTATAKLSIDGIEKNTILLLTKNGKEYSEVILLPNSYSDVKIKSFILEDYLGNKKEYKIE
jgi:hypothetical protein